MTRRLRIQHAAPRSRARTRGQGLVEFALVFPLFMFMLFGLIDGGRLVYQNTVVSQAAREGARLASVEASWLGSTDPSCGTSGGPVCPANVTALKAHVLAAVNRMVSPFGVVANGNVFLRCDTPGNAPTGSWAPGSPSCTSNTTGNLASVRVTLTFTPITPVLSGLVGTVVTSGSATMVIN
jgi:Flp pilus assembly protein TadG